MTPKTRDKENRRIGFRLMMDAGIDYNTVIYHYLSIGHLYSMLDNGSFHISRKYLFEDNREQEMLPKSMWFAFSAVGENVPPLNTESIQNDINKKRGKFIANSRKLTSCWSQGPYENILMWKGYTSPNNGVCVKTSIGKFVESLCTDSYEIWCGKIKYENKI